MTAGNTRAAAGGVLFLTLVAGFLLGMVWSRRSPEPAEPVATTAAAEPAEPDEDREPGTRRRGLIVERVGLSAEQKVQVDSVVGYARGMMRELRSDYNTGFDELVASTRSSIRAVLTTEQAAEYDALLADFDRRREMDEERERGSERSGARDRDPRERGGSSRENQQADRQERSDRMQRDGKGWSYSF